MFPLSVFLIAAPFSTVKSPLLLVIVVSPLTFSTTEFATKFIPLSLLLVIFIPPFSFLILPLIFKAPSLAFEISILPSFASTVPPIFATEPELDIVTLPLVFSIVPFADNVPFVFSTFILPLLTAILLVSVVSSPLPPLFLTVMFPIPKCCSKPASENLPPLFSAVMFPFSVFLTSAFSATVKSPSLLVIVVSPLIFVTLPFIFIAPALFVIPILPLSARTIPAISAFVPELVTVISPFLFSILPFVDNCPLEFVTLTLPLLFVIIESAVISRPVPLLDIAVFPSLLSIVPKIWILPPLAFVLLIEVLPSWFVILPPITD